RAWARRASESTSSSTRSSSAWPRRASSAAVASAEALEEILELALDLLPVDGADDRGRIDPDGGRGRRARDARRHLAAPVADDHVEVHATAGWPVLAGHRHLDDSARVPQVARRHDAPGDLVRTGDRVELERRGEERRRHVHAQQGRDRAADAHDPADEGERLGADHVPRPAAGLARARLRRRESSHAAPLSRSAPRASVRRLGSGHASTTRVILGLPKSMVPTAFGAPSVPPSVSVPRMGALTEVAGPAAVATSSAMSLPSTVTRALTGASARLRASPVTRRPSA